MRMLRTLLKVELKLSLRQLDLPIFGLIFPVIVALILAYLEPNKQMDALGAVFASVSTIGIAANGLMGLPLTLAGYRQQKVLKQYCVTPLNPTMILLVQWITKGLLSILSVCLIYLTLFICFGYVFQGNILLFCLYYFITMNSVFSLGMLIASLTRTVDSANAWTSIVYFPMLFLSGATIPLTVFPYFLQTIFTFLPLSQGITLLTRASQSIHQPFPLLNLSALLLITVCGMMISVKTFRWE